MIIDRIENASQYFCLGPQWKTALTAVQEYDPAKFQKGEAIMLDHGVKLLQFEYQTRDRSQLQLEAHRKYADIMFMAAGEESIAYKPTAQLQEITMPYDESMEALLAKLDPDFLALPLTQGTFVVFLPQDAHGPGLAVGEPATARRIVIKVPLEL